jgi:hypothetical protein
LEKDAMWAYADQGSYKMALRKAVKSYDKMKVRAEELKGLVETKFSDEKLFEGFCNSVYKQDPEVEEWLTELEEMVNA